MKKKSETHHDEYAECMEHMDLMHLMEHMIKLVESDDARYSFEFSSGNMMEVYDKKKNTSYVLKIEKIQYDETGNALNL